ncbi:MAG: DUF4837 family protein [Bacteroidales bacterium]|nr:DUF4837 family protein [Bacteroidales bacterium]MDD4671625.1 DUF4837 family protein [Bacteroidales bacterium]MDY0348832.1 DUF4837 family protein [Tenuifilaceae bacterium]
MKKTLAILPPLILMLLLTTSCDKGTGGKSSLLPNVTGSAGEVIVSMNRGVINDSIGKTLKSVLEDEYPMLPQSEPLFRPIMVPSQNFSNIFRTHRNIILIKVGEEFKKAQMVPQHDVWAAPQFVLNIVGPSYPAIEELVKKDKDKLVQMLEQNERNRVVQNATKYEVRVLRELIKEKFDVSMVFPKGYTLKLDTTDFVWISYETPSLSQGIFIYEYPYTDANTFTAEYLIAKRDSMLKRYVPGPTKGSYMITETLIPPVFQPLMYRDRYFGQLRGLWDVYGHPMGGPFISLTTVNETNNSIITVDGYVHAPKLDKRNYIRQVEALLLNTRLAEDKEKKE